MKDPLAAFLRHLARRARTPPPTPSAATATDLDEFQRFLAARDGGRARRPSTPARSARWLAALHARGLAPASIAPQAGRGAELLPVPRPPRRARAANPARQVRGPAPAAEAACRSCRWTRRTTWWTRAPSTAPCASATGRCSSCSTPAALRVSELRGPRPRRRSTAPQRTVRVLGKGRKERIVPCGDKAARRARRRGSAGAAEQRAGPLFMNARGGRLTARARAHASSTRGAARPASPAGEPAHAAPHLRHPPAGRGRRPAHDPGAARAQPAVHHPALHAREPASS